MYIVYFLGIILLAIILIIAVILLTPYTYVIQGDNTKNSRIELSVYCFYQTIEIKFIVHSLKNTEFRLNLFKYSKHIRFKNKTHDQKIANEKKSKKEKKKNNQKNSKEYANCFTFNFVQEIMQLVRGIIKEILPKEHFIHIKIGLKDPMHTGVLFGLYLNLRSLFSMNNMFLEPSFNNEILQFKVFIKGKIWLVKMIGDILKFIISTPVRKQIFLMMKR